MPLLKPLTRVDQLQLSAWSTHREPSHTGGPLRMPLEDAPWATGFSCFLFCCTTGVTANPGPAGLTMLMVVVAHDFPVGGAGSSGPCTSCPSACRRCSSESLQLVQLRSVTEGTIQTRLQAGRENPPQSASKRAHFRQAGKESTWKAPLRRR